MSWPDISFADVLVALGLVLVLEGLVYALFPETALRAVSKALELGASRLRELGLLAAIVGMVIIWAAG